MLLLLLSKPYSRNFCASQWRRTRDGAGEDMGPFREKGVPVSRPHKTIQAVPGGKHCCFQIALNFCAEL